MVNQWCEAEATVLLAQGGGIKVWALVGIATCPLIDASLKGVLVHGLQVFQRYRGRTGSGLHTKQRSLVGTEQACKDKRGSPKAAQWHTFHGTPHKLLIFYIQIEYYFIKINNRQTLTK
jgi:hypothetical protein